MCSSPEYVHLSLAACRRSAVIRRSVQKKDCGRLTTDGGARFLYFQDGQRRLIVVSATGKMKEKKFHTEIATADNRKVEYLKLIKEKVSK